ncbi:hypothetical protein FVEG_05257 [Fusarium verticillioides 7600]|uniref:Uncharacterized protein n=1 Tax=Gibberella moniliformis (strain M3125 / FGSC 7600) TaxID=334819 RepID=W7M9D8_GIBM7|nr:hypothetical protein FVEG_05257 [Fusarium verticillioides 7600]EWG44049.1 hypothetical protein FVEG_05257 [Fusarium verticillioides 7600]
MNNGGTRNENPPPPQIHLKVWSIDRIKAQTIRVGSPRASLTAWVETLDDLLRACTSKLLHADDPSSPALSSATLIRGTPEQKQNWEKECSHFACTRSRDRRQQ